MAEGIDLIDISGKPTVMRESIAQGTIKLRKATVKAMRRGTLRKGDALTVAKVAGIMAVKRTPTIIPACHNIEIDHIDIRFRLRGQHLVATCEVRACAKTGVEMEALVGVTTCLIVVWDMVKENEKDETGQYPWTEISSLKILKKVKKA